MRRLVPTLLFLALLALAGPDSAAAQSSERARLYEMYFKIDFTDVPAWVESYQTHEVPVLETLVEEGVLTGFNMYIHDTGGEYNVRYNLLAPNWDALGDYVDAYFARVDEEALEGFTSMVQEHVDQIWVVGGSSFPDGWEDASLVYESAFQLDFAAGQRWGDDFSEYTAPALKRAVDEGMLKAWIGLVHDTGGPHGIKFLYWFDDWDQTDDGLNFINEVRQELGMTMESTRGIRSHVDNIWRPVPKR